MFGSFQLSTPGIENRLGVREAKLFEYVAVVFHLVRIYSVDFDRDTEHVTFQPVTFLGFWGGRDVGRLLLICFVKSYINLLVKVLLDGV